jgi:uncharacterized protein
LIRRLSVVWPDPAPFRERPEGSPIRLLAISDDRDPALERAQNREALGRIDLIVGCGDLEPDYLGFVADAFVAPLAYIRGNHDAGGAWVAAGDRIPEPLPDAAVRENIGLRLVGLSWPRLGIRGRPDERKAWSQVLPLMAHSVIGRNGPLLVLSHSPPRGVGDAPDDPFHTGFSAYRWVADHLHPPLWLHGHTPAGGLEAWHVSVGGTTFANVTPAVVVELQPPGTGTADPPDRGEPLRSEAGSRR